MNLLLRISLRLLLRHCLLAGFRFIYFGFRDCRDLFSWFGDDGDLLARFRDCRDLLAGFGDDGDLLARFRHCRDLLVGFGNGWRKEWVDLLGMLLLGEEFGPERSGHGACYLSHIGR